MLKQEIRNALRAWRATPVLAVTAFLTLSLGVAANAVVFSVAHAVLFRALPYPAADRLVELFEQSPEISDPNQTFRVSAPNYLTWAARNRSFVALAAFQGTAFVVGGERDVERVTGAQITASLFRVLDVAPVVGRELRPDDEAPGAARVALIARSFWNRRYGGDPSVIGGTIVLDGERHEIVGIVPDSFHEIGRSQIGSVAMSQVFVPLQIDAAGDSRGNHVLRVAGRLRRDVSIGPARAEMSAIATAMSLEFPATNRGWGIRVVRIQDSRLEDGIRPSLLLLLAAVLAVMLIACANVSSLLVVKAAGRQRELALRAVLGASRLRLVRQILVESLCLAVASGVIGMVVTVVATGTLRSLLPPTLPRVAEVRVDALVFAFGLAVALGAGVLAGVLPALRAGRGDLPALTHARVGLGGPPRFVVRQGLVVTQMALATMLLVSGVLLLRSFAELQRVPLGFDAAGVLTARIQLPRAVYPDTVRVSRFYRKLLESLRDGPGLESAAIATSAPFGPGVRRGLAVGRWPSLPGAARQRVAEHIVSDDYFHALSIPLVAGRAFGARDRSGSAAVVIVSQATARELWPGLNPLGQQLERDGRPHEVVGVVGDVRGASDRGARGGSLQSDPRAAIYLSAEQSPQRAMTVLLRGAGGLDPGTLTQLLRGVTRTADPAVPIDQARGLADWLTETAATPRLTTTLAAVFAVIAVLLAAVGLYGVVAHAVGQRTSEIGLRMAVGATSIQVFGLVLRGGLTTAVLGAGMGMAGALLVSQALRTVLFGVQPDDPMTFGVAAVLLTLVSSTACCLPAWRAARVDPLVALRSE